MSLAMQPPVNVDQELEGTITRQLESLMRNNGSLRLKLRLARLDHEESTAELAAILKRDLNPIHPYKIEQSFRRLMKPGNFPDSLTCWLRPIRPSR